jgi:uncharacterized protein
MSRPPAAPATHCVDAAALARSEATVERSYTALEMPRLREAGAGPQGTVSVRLGFRHLEGQVAVDGALRGSVQLTCQRCMEPASIPLQEHFEVLLLPEESDAAEIGGRETVIVDPTRVDLLWLAEEQALLALPLVPMHEPSECSVRTETTEDEPSASEKGQTPFANLRDLLRQR